MSLWDVITGLTQVVADAQPKKPRKYKTACTPCAANAKLEQARARSNATYRSAPTPKVKTVR